MYDRPDVLISGINHGANLGNNIMYSGTVSAAAEGMIMGIPSIAISLASYETDNYDVSKKFAKKIVKKVIANGIPKDILLNVNVPYCNEDEIKGVRITRQGSQYFVDEFEERIDPRNGNYFWIKGEMIDEDKSIEFESPPLATVVEAYVTLYEPLPQLQQIPSPKTSEIVN